MNTNERIRLYRKSFACDECKRRKVRCSGGERCTNCVRDAKACLYSSPSQRLVSLQRRLRESEDKRRDMQRAWAFYLPHVDLATAMRELPQTGFDGGTTAPHEATETYEHEDATPSAEQSNADDYEFDESHDTDGSIDGMASLASAPRKSGYTGPQSGIAALNFLQSLPPYRPVAHTPLSCLGRDAVDAADEKPGVADRAVDWYFSLYHPAYPILHEGTFRAWVSGALTKPRDGSWPLLYNTVLAIGAFVGSPSSSHDDLPFFRRARAQLDVDILEKGSVGLVQALTILANYMQKRNKPNAGFILLGIAFSMAQAIGLHREFDAANTSPFTMEMRRRVWWTLFVFISGARLTLGRPAMSLAGITVGLPTNLDDRDVAIDMERLPPPQEHATVLSALVEHVRLARIANHVHEQLQSHGRLSGAKTTKLDETIRAWQDGLPVYYLGEQTGRLELPRRLLLWRATNLRIVLCRPALFHTVVSGAPLDMESDGIVGVCVAAAGECVAEICDFVDAMEVVRRGFAWYATLCLVSATYVQATCLIYSPGHALASEWTASLQRALGCLARLGLPVNMALRARDIIQHVLDMHSGAGSLPVGDVDSAYPEAILHPAGLSMDELTGPLSPGWFGSWMPQEQDGQLLDDGGGFMYGDVFDMS